MKKNTFKKICAGVFIFVLGIYLLFMGFRGFIGRMIQGRAKANIVEKTMHYYRLCQFEIHRNTGRFSPDLKPPGTSDCPLSAEVTIFSTETEFRKKYPQLCIKNIVIAVEPDTYTVIAEGNVDGEIKMYFGNNSNFLVGNPQCGWP